MVRSILICGFVVACASLVRATETPVDLRVVRGLIVKGPTGEIPGAWLNDASCTLIMVVDPVTGNVTNVYLEESSGDSTLNGIAANMLRKWKFRPGSPRLIRASFGTQRIWRDTQPDRKAQSLDDALTPFLGKGTLVYGFLPDYPSKPAWTTRHGTGVFELHVDRTGQVAKVGIKKSSGDAPFDQVALIGLRQWRFRRGPLIIELPLYFNLTPAKFSVRIPKYPGT